MKGFRLLADYGEQPLCDHSPAGFAGAAMVDRYTEWFVQRADNSASIAQANANESSTDPVMMCSFAPANAPATNVIAATSPEASDPATTRPM